MRHPRTSRDNATKRICARPTHGGDGPEGAAVAGVETVYGRDTVGNIARPSALGAQEQEVGVPTPGMGAMHV